MEGSAGFLQLQPFPLLLPHLCFFVALKCTSFLSAAFSLPFFLYVSPRLPSMPFSISSVSKPSFFLTLPSPGPSALPFCPSLELWISGSSL